MKVKKTSIPPDSLVKTYLPADYSDVYLYEVDCNNEINPDDVMVNFWTDFPGWVNALFKLRNFLVRFVGLKGSEENNWEEFERCIRTDSTYNFVSVPAKNNKETVLLMRDKHLDAYLSVHIGRNGTQKKISAITSVQFHNRLGRIYFVIIQPFHGLIVRSILKRAVNGLIKK